ncbi:hypothetical protein AAF712_015789 [Marasmius tenuissimus]|uniref:Uncharacterized protein n=1 Tax=Marasmius tenuissimus TaxID=585030 RepID=A0ABR2ZAR8_9AGAR
MAYHVAEKYQYIESYQYAIMMAVLGGLCAFVQQDTPSLGDRILPMQQPTIAPYELSHLYSIRDITSCSPDIVLMLCGITTIDGRRQAGLREIALIVMEMKRLTGGNFSLESEDQERIKVNWDEPGAKVKALHVLQSTLGQIFSQAICTLASYKSQEVLHHFFVCGSYFSVIIFKRCSDFDALLKEYDIHFVQDEGPANTQISEKIMIDFFFNPEKGRPMPTFTVYNEEMFEFDGQLFKPSVAFRAALKDALDAHGVKFQLSEPFLDLGNASLEQIETTRESGEGLFKKWLFSKSQPTPLDESSDADNTTKDPNFSPSPSLQSSSGQSQASVDDLWELDGEGRAIGDTTRKHERETSADPLEANTSQPDSPRRPVKNSCTK